jgi:hypothetical protein
MWLFFLFHLGFPGFETSAASPAVGWSSSAASHLLRHFVNGGPANYNASETKSSLDFAKRCKNVVNNATAGVDTAELRKLKAQLAKMKKKMGSGGGAPAADGGGGGGLKSRKPKMKKKK